MNDVSCRSELVLRERRGELSPAERTAYVAHLGLCESCRLARQLGRDFDEDAGLEPGDGARILALAEQARRWAARQNRGSKDVAPVPTRSRPSLRARTLLVAAALPLLIAAAASAGYGVYRARVSHEEGAPAAGTKKATAPPRAPRYAPATREPVPEPAPAAPESTVAVPPRAAAAARVPARTRGTAAERFELANAARQSGDIARAITLYRELERDFPASPEAAASELRLGSLLIERGRAGAALEQFERHLRRPGALVPEALYGRGRALAALDEATAERQTWIRLLRDFSTSPYAAHARRRLESLEGRGSVSQE